jgi:hypothetical protein
MGVLWPRLLYSVFVCGFIDAVHLVWFFGEIAAVGVKSTRSRVDRCVCCLGFGVSVLSEALHLFCEQGCDRFVFAQLKPRDL